MNSFQVLTSSESNEWYTPPEITDAAGRVIQGIELDPASCELAQQWIQAGRYFTQEQDGYSQPWIAKSVWLNPPYGARNTANSIYGASAWIEKATSAYENGFVGQLILLCRGDSKPLKKLQATTICCVADRIKFISPSDPGKKNPVPGTKIFYLGPNYAAFAREFR